MRFCLCVMVLLPLLFRLPRTRRVRAHGNRAPRQILTLPFICRLKIKKLKKNQQLLSRYT
jgi:hypothetical protein